MRPKSLILRKGGKLMPRLNGSFTTFVLAAGVAAGISYAVLTEGFAKEPPTLPQAIRSLIGTSSAFAEDASSPAAASPVPEQRWAASATGRIEPKSGNVALLPQIGGQIVDVPVKTNDVVRKGDLLVQLDDGQYLDRIEVARAEEAVRVGERAEEPAEGLVKERQEAEDAMFDAESAVFEAWRTFDAVLMDARDGGATEQDVREARDRIKSLESNLVAKRDAYRKLADRDDIAPPGRLESGLTIARAELALARNAFEKTRVRAPFDGTVLNVFARVGETAGPDAGRPLMAFGDLSHMRVRAEVEERDVDKVQVGQRVIVKADAYPDREFEGTVTEVASALGSPRITSRGPRRPNDVDVLEVVADLDGSPPLLTGMRVDVFFKPMGKDKRTAKVD